MERAGFMSSPGIPGHARTTPRRSQPWTGGQDNWPSRLGDGVLGEADDERAAGALLRLHGERRFGPERVDSEGVGADLGLDEQRRDAGRHPSHADE